MRFEKNIVNNKGISQACIFEQMIIGREKDFKTIEFSLCSNYSKQAKVIGKEQIKERVVERGWRRADTVCMNT